MTESSLCPPRWAKDMAIAIALVVSLCINLILLQMISISALTEEKATNAVEASEDVKAMRDSLERINQELDEKQFELNATRRQLEQMRSRQADGGDGTTYFDPLLSPANDQQ